jgi:hypothetical protein
MTLSHDSGGVHVIQVRTVDEQLHDLPKGLSFFDPFFRHEVKEEIEAGGEAFVSKDLGGITNGLFIYDGYEATGTVFTKSREVFDYFRRLKPSSYIFSELEVEGLPKEVWNIWQMDVDRAPLDYRFRYNVSMEGKVEEIERFIALTQPEMNMRWVRVALRNGDKCFVVRIGGRIVGIAWLTIVGRMARSYGLYVEPQFRRMGVTRDNLHARLIYLRSRHVHTLVNEIAESNTASSGHVEKAGEEIVGKIYLYTTPDLGGQPQFG